jgi:hypothetical protein
MAMQYPRREAARQLEAGAFLSPCQVSRFITVIYGLYGFGLYPYLPRAKRLLTTATTTLRVEDG